MKKRWLILAGVLVLLLAGGAFLRFAPREQVPPIPGVTLQLGDPVTYETDTVPGLSMEVVGGTVSSTGAAVRLVNATDADYIVAGTETSCGVNVERGGVWYAVVVNRYVHTAEWNGWLLGSGETVEQTLDWEIDYNALPKGHYRAVRSMSADWEKSDVVRLSAEFYVE